MKEPPNLIITTRSAEQTRGLGRLLGAHAPANTCIALRGNLGAGKTQLARGIALGANVDDPTLVASPTYVLLNIYPGQKPVFHLDAYRIRAEEDFQAVGFDELLDAGGITVVEWAEKIPHLLPPERLDIFIEPGDTANDRVLRLVPASDAAHQLIVKVAAAQNASPPVP